MLDYYHLEYKDPAKKSADGLIWFPLYVTNCFSLADFRILSLSLMFTILINVYYFHYNVSWCLFLGFILFGTLEFLDLNICFFLQSREVFSYFFFSNNFSIPSSVFFSLCPLEYGCHSTWCCPNDHLKYLYFFSFCCYAWVNFIALSSNLSFFLFSFNLLLSPAVYFSFQLQLLFGIFLCFLFLSWNSQCIYPFFLRVRQTFWYLLNSFIKMIAYLCFI